MAWSLNGFPFPYGNSYNLMKAIWVYTCSTCLCWTFKAHPCIDRAPSASSKKIPSISLGCCLYLQYLLPSSSLGTVRSESEPHKTHLSQTPPGKVVSSSAILLLHATAVVCCTWPLYRPQIGLLFYFVLLLNWELLSTIENLVWKCKVTCVKFFCVFHKSCSARVSCTVLCLHLICCFWLDLIIIQHLQCK